MSFARSQTALVAILAAAAVLVGVAGMFVLVMPQRSEVAHVSKQLLVAESTLVNAHTLAGKQGRVEATDLFRLREAMPDTDQMPGILIALSRIAEASSVTIVSVRPSPRIQLRSYSALPIVLVLDGGYSDVTDFLQRLRESVQTTHGRLAVTGRLFVPNQIQFQSSDGRTVEATVNLDAFEYGAPAPTSATAGVSAENGGSTATTTTTTTASSG